MYTLTNSLLSPSSLILKSSTTSSTISFSASSSTRGLQPAHCSLRREWSSSLELPLLPFQPKELLIPSECKTLHLYEARYLALLEESLKGQKLFVHIVLEPLISAKSSSKSFAARYGCLVFIERVERLGIGALVTIRGLGRVSIVDLPQLEPYIRGIIVPVQDDTLEDERDIDSKILELVESIQNLHGLQMKLKASKDELLQTRTKDSLIWAEKQVSVDCDPNFLPKLSERISFVPLQPVSGASSSELSTLLRAKMQAMETKDTFERLTIGIKFVQDNIAMLAAKLAIQSLEL